MPQRRIRPEGSSSLLPTVLTGLGIGLAIGLLAGELLAGRGRKALIPWRRKRAAPPSQADLTSRVRQSLQALLGAEANGLTLVPIGRNGLELHGWVASRSSRSRAIRAVRELLGGDLTLVDRLLVWGEDDAPLPPRTPPNRPTIVRDEEPEVA